MYFGSMYYSCMHTNTLSVPRHFLGGVPEPPDAAICPQAHPFWVSDIQDAHESCST